MIKCVVLDLDGTVYISGRLIEGAKEAIDYLRKKVKVMFLTNNSSVCREIYLKKLNDLGLEASIDEIYTSSTATINYLKNKNQTKNIYLVGTKELKKEFLDNDIKLAQTKNQIEKLFLNPKKATVVLAFDTQLNYEKLLIATRLINLGADYIATHPDLVCPSLNGDMPDCGSFISLILSATNKSPNVICGKPHKTMAQGITQLGFKNDEILMVGDRLYTDIKFAQNNQFKSCLVLSGETTLETLQALQNQQNQQNQKEILQNENNINADFVLNSIKDIKKIV